jgi:hypothetical protein
MKKYVCILVWLFPLLSFGQGQNLQFMKEDNGFLNDVNGRPMMLRSEYLIEGSPFFYQDYCSANLKVRNGKSYNGVQVKLNLQQNLVIYDAGDGKEMAAITPIEKIVFLNCADPSKNQVFRSGFPPIDGQTVNSFYLVLDSGRVTLLKQIGVNYRDVKYYGSNQTTRVFEQKEMLYAYQPGMGMKRLAKEEAAVLALLSDQRKALQSFLAANDLKCRKEADLVKAFQFYNAIQQ